MAVITEAVRPFFQKIASVRPPRRAPRVKQRRETAALSTKATWRLRYAIKIKAIAQATVDILLKRKKNASLRCGSRCFTKSIVETEASDVRAELTEDIAAERMATIRKPFRMCGTSVIMKMGKTKSLALMPGRDSGSGI